MFKLNYIKIKENDTIRVHPLIKSDLIDNELIGMMMGKNLTNDSIPEINIYIGNQYITDPIIQSDINSLAYAQEIDRVDHDPGFIYRTLLDQMDLIILKLQNTVQELWLSDNSSNTISNTDIQVDITQFQITSERLVYIGISDNVITDVSELIHKDMVMPHNFTNTVLTPSDIQDQRVNYKLSNKNIEPKSGISLGDTTSQVSSELSKLRRVYLSIDSISTTQSGSVSYIKFDGITYRYFGITKTIYYQLPYDSTATPSWVTLYQQLSELPGIYLDPIPYEYYKDNFESYVDKSYPMIIEYNHRLYLKLFKDSNDINCTPRKDWRLDISGGSPSSIVLNYFNGYNFGSNVNSNSSNNLNWIAL